MGPRPNELPQGLTDPLHYANPAWVLLPLLVLLIGAIAALVWWLGKRTHRAAHATGLDKATSGPSTGGNRPVGLAGQIAALRKRFLEQQSYREGSHALALLLREHFTRRRGQRLLTLTAREIRAPQLDLARVRATIQALADVQSKDAVPEDPR